ncbi:MAG: LysM peptidoglycan-binding domain-containing protein [Tannerellaceae bacterium]|jgi:membrane-bound lytic murein transglycosylase D|nr:LysM peptidoglycan-binding domain-containing protein [Tannerellaceae bacterium]
MLKKLIIAGIFVGCTLIAAGQSNKPEGDDTPPEFERAYEQLLSKKGISSEQGNYSNGAIIFDDSTYIKRLYSLPTKMELAFNPAVKQQIEYYAGRRKSQVSYMLGEGKYYFPIFEEALDREGLPLELKYLPVIESALNPKARSRMGASGLWQFMAATGKMYDLEINSLVDERFDPHKSTDAAVKYLRSLYSKYSDWNLVIAAYNCGPGNVDKAIRRSGGLTDYWSIYPYLPRETRGYVPIFIAATYIMNYYQEHGIDPSVGTKPASMDSVVINKNLHFQQISDVLNIPIDDIRRYNPQFKSDMIPGEYKGYSLNLPMDRLTAFIDKEESIFAYKPDQFLNHRKIAGLDVVSGGSSSNTKTITYRVKKGDTLSKVASRYGVSSAQIKSWNGLSSNKLNTGRRLKIYKTAAPVAGTASNTEPASNAPDIEGKYTGTPIGGSNAAVEKQARTTTIYYKIRKGDTWNKITQKNNVSVSDIKKWNNIKNNNLIAGKTLKIQKIEYVDVPVIEEPKLPEPELAYVEIDSTFTIDIFDGYLKKVDMDKASLPLINISSADDIPVRKKTDDTKLIYHKVKIGETMTQIAARYNVSQKDIIFWNKLSSNTAKVGQRLLILLPEKEAANAAGKSSNDTFSADK